MRHFPLVFVLALCWLGSCTSRETPVDKQRLRGNDYRLFQGTPAWELAKAVQDEDTVRLVHLVRQQQVPVDYPEPRFGKTLLMLTVANEQYRSCKTLLELGADPNQHDRYNGSSAIIYAAGFTENERYNLAILQLLLTHRANPSDVETGPRRAGYTGRKTPLSEASERTMDKVKLLVKAGANINYRNEYGTTALSTAVVLDKLDIALYLLEHGADYKAVMDTAGGKNWYLADELRLQILALGSPEYQQKMRIVAFLKHRGIDYRQAAIPPYVLEQAKELFPSQWQEYLQKY
jgi:ankyrin repeat protein